MIINDRPPPAGEGCAHVSVTRQSVFLNPFLLCFPLLPFPIGMFGVECSSSRVWKRFPRSMDPQGDKGELGTLPSSTLRGLRLGATLMCYGVAAALLTTLLTGICPVGYATNVGGWMAALLVCGHSFLRLVPLVWAESGRITYVRATEIKQMLLPRTRKARLTAYVMLVDLIAVPLVVGSCVFRETFMGVVGAVPLYPPRVASSAAFYIMFWLLPPAAIAANVLYFLSLSQERADPYFFAHHEREQRISEAAAGAVAALLVPGYTVLLAALPCDIDTSAEVVAGGDVVQRMRYAAGTRCLSGAHRTHIFFAVLLLLLLQVSMDISLGTLQRLKEPHSMRQLEEPSMDMLFVELLRLVRLLAVVLLTATPSALHCLLVSVFSTVLLLWLLLGRFSSTVQLIQEGYVRILGVVSASSLLGAGAAILLGRNVWGAVAWLLLWLALAALAGYRQVFAQASKATWVSDLYVLLLLLLLLFLHSSDLRPFFQHISSSLPHTYDPSHIIWPGHLLDRLNDPRHRRDHPLPSTITLPYFWRQSPEGGPMDQKGLLEACSATLHVADADAACASAVTRSWSDMDHSRLMLTFGTTSLLYSAVGQPFFLVIARQQSAVQPLSAAQVFRAAIRRDGWRSLFRGTGLSVSGTVLSELVYYLCLETGKEKLPLGTLEARSFGAGLAAELSSTLVFNPFAVVSQIQMVAGPSSTTCEYPYRSAAATTRALIADHGWHCLFRGAFVSLLVAPVVGGWWYVYEGLKRRVYAVAPRALEALPPRLARRLPRWCTSTSDNPLINSAVGGATNLLFCVVMNPIYVLRLRVQTTPSAAPHPFRSAAADMMRREGPRALWKGLSINMLMAALGGPTATRTHEFQYINTHSMLPTSQLLTSSCVQVVARRPPRPNPRDWSLGVCVSLMFVRYIGLGRQPHPCTYISDSTFVIQNQRIIIIITSILLFIYIFIFIF
eukprot:gene6637-4756_t